MGKPLAGKGIVVTRPRELADGLATLVREAGGEPWVFPTIDIVPSAQPVTDLAARVERADAVVFISRTAVRKALEQLSGWPGSATAYAVGAGTRTALQRAGIPAQAPVEGADSEALLALPGLQSMAGKRVLLVCGEGGRQVLGDAFRERGATVERAELYRRALPRTDPSALLEAWAAGRIHAVTASSVGSVTNLFALVGGTGAAHLRRTALVVPHERVADAARSLGVRDVVVAAGPGDEQTLARLVAYFAIHG